MVATNLYLLDDCWEHVFKSILNNDDDDNNNNNYYLKSLSLLSKQFLSITNCLKFSLKICEPTLPFLPRLFQRFINLTSIDLTRFSRDLNALLCEISCFSIDNLNIKSLKFSIQSKFPAIGLLNFSKKITTLTSLTIFSTPSLCANNLILISDCFPLLEELNLIDSVFKPYLEEPDISDVAVNSMFMAFSKLRKVNLSVYFINDSLFLNLCKNCEFLEEIILTQRQFLTQNGIAAAIREIPTLRSFSIKWLTPDDKISSHLIQSLVSLNGLTCLDLSFSYISDELLSSIAMKGLPLRKLVLKNCRGYSYCGIFCLLSKCRYIQHLDLRYNYFLIDDHVADLSLFLHDLVFINLSYCRMLTHLAFFALTRKCPSLSEIIMERTSIGDTMVEDSKSMMNLVVNPQLKCLRLASNSYMRDENIIMFSSICPNLQLLDLSGCHGISEGIGEVLRCRKIIHLNLAYCYGLKPLQMNFKVSTLEVLNLSFSNIDDRSLYAISKSCSGLLQLDLGYCYNVTEKGVREVAAKCTKLREINLEYCHKVDAHIVESMIFTRPSLRKIMAPPRFSCSNSERKDFLHHGCHVC